MEGCGGGPISPRAPFDGGIQLGLETNFFAATLGVDDKMPFLQMLQTLHPTPMKNNLIKAENQIHDVEMPELQSPVTSEVKNPTQVSPDKVSVAKCKAESSSKTKMHKPKRARLVVGNKKDAEKQRMTHIAVERNRRRQMSDYFSVLRSLLPPAYAEKGDQGSIVGGAIDYVKKLEHVLQFLQAQKRQKQMDGAETVSNSSETSNIVTTSTSSSSASLEEDCDKKLKQLHKAEVSIRMVQTHVNLHIECEGMKQSQLIKFLGAIEGLGLTILHLHITSIHKPSFYSFSFKVEDECKVRSAEEISESVEKILNSINIYRRLETPV